MNAIPGAAPLPKGTGIILVDHGSTRIEANDMLDQVVQLFREESGAKIVEPAHMELAPPSIADAYRKCVDQGAERIVIHPYFLSPGRHSTADIPRMAQEAAAEHPGIPFVVTDALGLDPQLSQVILRRIHEALDR